MIDRILFVFFLSTFCISCNEFNQKENYNSDDSLSIETESQLDSTQIAEEMPTLKDTLQINPDLRSRVVYFKIVAARDFDTWGPDSIVQYTYSGDTLTLKLLQEVHGRHEWPMFWLDKVKIVSKTLVLEVKDPNEKAMPKGSKMRVGPCKCIGYYFLYVKLLDIKTEPEVVKVNEQTFRMMKN